MTAQETPPTPATDKGLASDPAPNAAPDGNSEQWPIRAERAAVLLHCGVRRVKALAKQHGIGRRSGRAVIFSREDFGALYAALPLPGRSQMESERAPLLSELMMKRRLKAHLRELRSQPRSKAKPSTRRGPRNYLKPAKPEKE